MKRDNLKSTETRMVHVRLTAELHKRVRISVAESDMTLQDWMAMAIENELDHRDEERAKRPT